MSFGNSLCLDEFYAEAPPEIINKKLNFNSFPLCNQGFTVHYSGISKTPIWVAEKLSPERLSIRIKRDKRQFHSIMTIIKIHGVRSKKPPEQW